jgi:DNA (cytosine-5)-methyltransferase 1
MWVRYLIDKERRVVDRFRRKVLAKERASAILIRIVCRAFVDEGFEVVWANEKDQFAAKTYRHNFPDTDLYEKSIEELSVVADRLRRVDVLIGGFPCQPFSMAGAKGGFDDPRGRLFFQIIRLLREFGPQRPHILLLENVTYLLAHDNRRTFARIAQEIQQAGYWFMPNTNCATLNTRIHTEIPQNRERLYMAALSWEVFDENRFEFPQRVENTKNYREFLDLTGRADDWFYFPEDSKWRRMFQESMAAGDPDRVYHLRRHYVREIKAFQVPTLTAHMGDGGHNMPVIRDDWGIRKLTPEECLRLQGIQDGTITFPPDVSRSQRYKQIGNAVTVPLVRKLASECRRQLDSLSRRRS